MSFNVDLNIPEKILENCFNPLKSGQCLLILDLVDIDIQKDVCFNPLKSGQCLLIA